MTTSSLETPEKSATLEPESTRDPFQQGPYRRVRSLRALGGSFWASLRFLLQTEVHVYCFAVAANLLLSFFPFLVVMIVLCKSVLHWQAAVDVIVHSVNDYFPERFGVNFQNYLLGAAAQRKFSWLSLFLLLFTANGIFEPLEVALNRIWRVRENRSFLHNQAVSLGLIFLCGALVLATTCITALNVQFLTTRFGTSQMGGVMRLILFRAIALAISVLMIFLIYWLLPNIKIPVRRLGIVSVIVGALLQVLQYLNVATWPWLRDKLQNEVPPFVQSISIILWGFCAAMIILAGAEWSARVTVDSPENKLPASAG